MCLEFVRAKDVLVYLVTKCGQRGQENYNVIVSEATKKQYS